MKMFPIHSDTRSKHPDLPRGILWSIVGPHEAQARTNHDQTLERLAERGGCNAVELYAICHGVGWSGLRKLDHDVSLEWLRVVAAQGFLGVIGRVEL